ncbi:MAG TPA: aspartyl protease family protein [Candidatus Limnocylindrales bacterium]|nr:aspartyl protease family protein [Candidatus Limnocylindrales bacterium]
MLLMRTRKWAIFCCFLSLPLFSQSNQALPKPDAPAASADSAAKTSPAPAIPLMLARGLLKDRKYTEAAGAFSELVAKEPTIEEAQLGLVRSLIHIRKIDEAQAAAKSALASLPGSAEVHAVAGDAEFRVGNFGQAEVEYKAAIKLDGNSARGWFGLGRIYEIISMRKHARDVYQKAHQLNPEDGQIFEHWIALLPYDQRLEALKKRAGEHPTERQAERIKLLSQYVGRKPWELATANKPVQITMNPYGRRLAATNDAAVGNRVGATTISEGFALQVNFNDRAGAMLLVDTGASGITIGRKLAEKAGVVKIADSYMFGIGDEGIVPTYLGWVDKLRIGELEFHNCIVDVSSRTDILDNEGLIGPEVFHDFLVTLDFKERKLLLSPLPKSPNAPAGEDEFAQDRYIAPEMQGFSKYFRFGHDLVVSALVNDKATGNFILDTGAGINSITPRFAALVTKATADDEYRMRGVSGKVNRVLTGQKAVFQIANMRLESHELPVFDTNISSSEGTEISGFIGIRTLVQMKMTIDYRDGLVNLQVYEFRKSRE